MKQVIHVTTLENDNPTNEDPSHQEAVLDALIHIANGDITHVGHTVSAGESWSFYSTLIIWDDGAS